MIASLYIGKGKVKLSLDNRIEALRTRHASLDTQLKNLLDSPSATELEISAVKRGKLRLKDEIARLSRSQENNPENTGWYPQPPIEGSAVAA